MILVLAFSRNLDRADNYKYTLMVIGFVLLLSPLFPGLGQEIYFSIAFESGINFIMNQTTLDKHDLGLARTQ